MTNAVVPLRSGGAIHGIIPQTIEEVFRLAQGIAASGLAPKDMNTPEKITVAIMTGLEIGLPPMFALQKIAIVNGRPCLWGDAIPALLWARGFKLHERLEGKSGSTRVAFCKVIRPDGTEIERAFSETDALRAGLLKKPGPWTQYPDRMLAMRARSYACRDGAADALSGLYLREELDEPARDITPARSPVLEIPDDIPDRPAEAEQPQEAQDEPIVDVDGYLEKLADQIALCTSSEELDEITVGNADIIERLPAAQKRTAKKWLKEAAE